MADATGPLAGLKVVDVTHMLAGPYCTWLLGSLGADVVKVEHPERGDFTRSIAPHREGMSLYFASVNRNKRSLGLDLKKEDGKAVMRRLVASADILVENNRPGVMERLGLGYAALKEVNPRLVYASISGFGHTGPYRERPAFDAVVQAMSGLMSITGEAGRGPVRVGTSVGDITASLFATVGILAAVQERARTGEGTYVDVAMLNSQISLLENAFSRFLNTGSVPARIGTRHPLVTPFQAFETADDPLVVCCDTERQWQALCGVLDRPELPSDSRFADGTARTNNHAALEPILAERFRECRRSTWLPLLAAADVPSGPVNTIADAAQDPQIAARGMIVGSAGGRYAAQPIHMHSLDRKSDRPAPTLGADSYDILTEIALSPAEIAELRRTRVI